MKKRTEGSQDEVRKEMDYIKHGNYKNKHKRKPVKSSEQEKASESSKFRKK